MQLLLAEEYADLSLWTEAIARVCEKCSLPLPPLADCFPISGGPTVVFEINEDTIIKFYAREAPVRLLRLSKCKQHCLTAKSLQSVVPMFSAV